jgi:hypothetical protein
MEEFLQNHKEQLLALVRSDGWHFLMQGIVDEEVCVILDRLNSLPLVGEESSALYAYYRGQLDFIKTIYNLEVLIRLLDLEPAQQEVLEAGIAAKFRNLYYRIIGVIRR